MSNPLQPSMLAFQLREKLVQSCENILNGKSSAGIILSGGVDTGAVLAACRLARERNPTLPKLSVALTVFASANAPDRLYAIRLAKEYELTHVCIETNGNELLDKCLLPTVSALRSFDPMNGRNSLVIELALQRAKSDFPQIDVWLSGDAADELFGGYSFMWPGDEPEWTVKRNKMCFKWMFTGDALSKQKEVVLLSPFRDEEVVQFAIKHCHKSDCIAQRWLIAAVGDVPELRETGKVVLRDAFPENTSSYRRKDPIEVGSGCVDFRENAEEFFQARFAPQQAELTYPLYKLNFRNAEHRLFFDCFLKVFPEMKGVGVMRRDEVEDLTNKAFCKACGFQLVMETSTFCRGLSILFHNKKVLINAFKKYVASFQLNNNKIY